MKEIRHIHFVGIKGVGMAPLAIIAKEAGFTVTGSDIADGFITDTILQKHGIIPYVGFAEEHVDSADVVVTTGAHGGYDNPEVLFAKKQNLPIFTQGQAVDEFMKGEFFGIKKSIGISVSGTHGKTTTTAMVAKLLQDGGQNPSWVIGTSEVASLGFGGHFGKGAYFVAEADEYANEPTYDKTPKLLLQHPKIAVVTNIEHDHPDVYKTIDDVRNTFLQFAQQLPVDGLFVACGDDMQVVKLLKEFNGHAITYGFLSHNTIQIKNVSSDSHGSQWTVVDSGKEYNLTLALSGEHNILNATAAYIVAKKCGVSLQDIQRSLATFNGTKRRMEYIGQLKSGALLYDDYAHHPTEIRKTLQTLRKKYPNKKIVCLFQPHTYSRTKLLFDQFVDSLSLADEVILTDIYASQREPFDPSVSSAMLVEKLRLKSAAFLAKTLPDVVKYINKKHYSTDVVILTMGAGDIYTISQQVLEYEGD